MRPERTLASSDKKGPPGELAMNRVSRDIVDSSGHVLLLFCYADSAALEQLPCVIVRFSRTLCPRRGEYRLARLAAKYGPEADLASVLHAVTLDCPYSRHPSRPKPEKYEARCGARYEDLAAEALVPEDVPPAAERAKLTVIDGNKD
jgi:hypothetical protein